MSTADTAQISALIGDFDGRDDFRAFLKEARDSCRSQWNFVDAMRINRVLLNRQLFEKAYTEALTRSAQALLASGRASEFGDGEFAKWFLEWLIENWPTILEIIKALIPIFAGGLMSVNSNVILLLFGIVQCLL